MRGSRLAIGETGGALAAEDLLPEGAADGIELARLSGAGRRRRIRRGRSDMAHHWIGDLLGKGGPSTLEFLAELARTKAPVRVEVENSQVRFNSQLTLKRGVVVIAKPPGLREGFGTDTFVRMHTLHGASHEFRMKVKSPHVNLASGNAVFICEAPHSEVSSQRNSERFDVTRYNNLRLVMNTVEFRLQDVSKSGLRAIATPSEAERFFPLNHELRSAHLKLGAKVRVDLEKLVPRARLPVAVGCEFTIASDPTSGRYLTHLLDSLKKTEEERLMKLG